MMDFEFESDEEEQLEKAVREILEERKKKVGRVMQTTTHHDHQIMISYEPDSYDGKSRSIGDAENDDMITEVDDESSKYQNEENGHLIDPMNDGKKIASGLDDSSTTGEGISIPRIPPEKHEIKRERNLKKLEVIMNGEEGKKANRKLTLMDYRGKHKLNLIDENIYIHPSGYEYQIYHEGKVIDKYSLRQFLETKVLRTESGKLLCKVHSNCCFKKQRSRNADSKHFHNLLEHIQASFITYLCRFCFRTFCYRTCIERHFNIHKRCQRGSQSSWNQPMYGSSIVARKFTKNTSELTLINSKMKCELNITDKYINRHPKTGHEYQIYYKGQAIDEEDIERVVKKNTINDGESGKLLCGIHQDCVYSDPEKLMKKSRVYSLHNHIRYALMIYLCRSCFNALGSYQTLIGHFKIHARNCLR
ncbi:uncharacterized protein LOC141856545 [Brevipalpus obovatus]|uniref:uncharacterized protein LOC141856545 n=1 Tax=Brevipalpus obovatus TaxID=246614 RepID=UPI003D9FA1E8